MATDKELKARLKQKLDAEYKDFFPVKKLKELGFARCHCSICKRAFWSAKPREICGDPECEGNYGFIGNKREDVDFIEVWKRFDKLFQAQGYTSIKRYPSVARWNPSMYFTIASIADFQPYVVSGETDPPAEKLIVPQTCIRFNDTDNVGITGSHNTGFTMIGQHAFLPKERFDQAQLFQDYYNWFTIGLRLKPEEFVIHEDAWAGGGNFGPCLEFFSSGCEIGNQVYMMFEDTPEGAKELKQKVLDMGMGQERCAWFLSGTPTLFEASFPTVIRYLKERTKVQINDDLMKKFVPMAGLLNIDEVDSVDEQWKKISKATGYSVEELKANVIPLSGIYSIADHTRTLLYAISDGALPSNVGGGYNLRVIYKRMMNFIESNDWKIDMDKVFLLQAEYLKPQYPELLEKIPLIKKIIAVENRKYLENKKKNTQIVMNMIEKEGKNIEEKLIQLYDSNGILPEEIAKMARSKGIKVDVPSNFYAMVAERHENSEKVYTTKKDRGLKLDDVGETTPLYFKNWDLVDFNAFVIKVSGKYVILDQTAFYPTSGGQLNDKGTINGIDVVDVFKQGNIVVHELKEEPNFKEKDKIAGKINIDRRMQLAQHHTGAHILNGAAKAILGEHIWQAGAAKSPEKARLDITHYDNLTEEEIEKIEDLANHIIKENRIVMKSFMDRNIAEAEYGFTLYQGGAVPGKRLRIVNIQDFDVEACGGTHLDLTGDVRKLKITKTSKIQDGVIRIEFVAGKAAEKYFGKKIEQASEVAALLECSPSQIPGRAQELFDKWKKATKAKKKQKPMDDEWFNLTSKSEFEGDALQEAASLLKTQKEYLLKTIEKFKSQLDELKNG